MFVYNEVGDGMKELYIDFDGVILDTIQVSYEMLEQEGIDSKDFPKTVEFFQRLDWKSFLKQCHPIHNSMECIQTILDSNLFSVSILTHVTSLEEAVEKVKYIRKYFKDITVIPVPKVISKTKMVHTEGAILIDDYAGNLREWQAAGGIGVRFSEKRSGKGFLVVDYLDQIIELVEEMEKTN